MLFKCSYCNCEMDRHYRAVLTNPFCEHCIVDRLVISGCVSTIGWNMEIVNDYVSLIPSDAI